MHTDGSRKRTGGTNRSHVEDVHNTGSCTRHETRTRRKHNHNPPTHASPSHPYPSRNTPYKDITRRTLATSEDRDSGIRQRRGCKISSSYAEICSAPSSRRHVEDVHNVGVATAVRCARHETCTRNQQNKPPPTQPSHPPTKTEQHAKIRK